MRALLIALSLGVAGAALADDAAYQAGGFPRDEVSLRALDNAQLRIVRRAGAMCWHTTVGIRAAVRGCLIGETESAIANSRDPALIAFHKALPFYARYDEYRSAWYWQRLVQS